jgi:hypothetical protein
MTLSLSAKAMPNGMYLRVQQSLLCMDIADGRDRF